MLEESPYPNLDEVEAELARRSLREYMAWVWPIVEPSTPFISGWHIDAICDHLEAVTRREIRNLIVTIAPRHTKSLIMSVAWPTWTWTNDPTLRFLFASYSESLSTEHAVKSRRVIESVKYQQAFGDKIKLTTDQNIKTYYENTATGYRISTSVGGSATGRGGDALVIDDPHNVKEANSDIVRQSVLDWYDQVWSSRLNDPQRGCRVIIMQRVHQADLVGHVKERDDFVHLNLPTLYEKTAWVSPIGWKDPRTEEGELLCPVRFGPVAVQDAQRVLGSAGFAAQHQQRPTPAGGGMLKRAWFKFYKEPPDPDGGWDDLLQSWDMAFKDLKGSDFVVGGVWGRIGARKYLLDQVRGRLDFPATLMAVRTLSAKWPNVLTKLVEDKANGPAVIQTLQSDVDGLIAVNPEGGKVARAAAVSPSIEAGNVYLPDPSLAPWVEDFLSECEAFPNGAHDDQVDQMTQALLRMSNQIEPLRLLGGGNGHNGNGKSSIEESVLRDGWFWPGGS